MKTTAKKTLNVLIAVACAGSLILAAGLAAAHDLWLTVSNPQVGKPAVVLAGYGHDFPVGEEVEQELLAPVKIIGAKGTAVANLSDKQQFTSATPLAKGSYIVVGGRKAQWFTQCPDGTQHKPKDQVKDAGKCVRTAKYAKAILNLGGAAGDVSKPVGHPLEIVPLSNPGPLKKGGELEVLVLHNGKPMAKADLMGTLAGFSSESNTYAFSGRTNDEGKLKVKMLAGGVWLLRTSYRRPFDDLTKCDEFGETATLTYVVE